MGAESLLRAAERGEASAIEVLGDWAAERGRHVAEYMAPDAEAFDLDGSGSGSGSGDG